MSIKMLVTSCRHHLFLTTRAELSRTRTPSALALAPRVDPIQFKPRRPPSTATSSPFPDLHDYPPSDRTAPHRVRRRPWKPCTRSRTFRQRPHATRPRPGRPRYQARPSTRDRIASPIDLERSSRAHRGIPKPAPTIFVVASTAEGRGSRHVRSRGSRRT
jgi:hypothetical protein